MDISNIIYDTIYHMDIKTVDTGQIIQKIIEAIKPLNPFKVILFGSYAYGQPAMDSDIDLLVVLNEEYIPEDYNEDMQLYLRVASRIREIRKRFPIDLIVYTKSMYEKALALDNSFIKEISKKGISIL